jgi:hypothetical protein
MVSVITSCDVDHGFIGGVIVSVITSCEYRVLPATSGDRHSFWCWCCPVTSIISCFGFSNNQNIHPHVESTVLCLHTINDQLWLLFSESNGL